VLVSEEVYRQAKPDVVLKRSFEIRLKGIHDPVNLYVLENLNAQRT
jgi:class 3 adenylate cyclase